MYAPPPPWIVDRLRRAGGSVPFKTYMDWVLHDPDHGFYGSGVAAIGPRGDFATSPSLGGEFAALLLPQLIEWLAQIPGEQLSLVEAGPGQGQLARQLMEGLVQQDSELIRRLELVLVEPNPGMVIRQRKALRGCPSTDPFPVRWADWKDLHLSPVKGIVIAHEVLDALPVDRLLWDGAQWRWQVVRLQGEHLCMEAGPPLEGEELRAAIAPFPPQPYRPPGWCSEVHSSLTPWFLSCGRALQDGALLVIDYAMEAKRYYSASRPNGTLMAYRGQRATDNPFLEPGMWDLTAHLCLEAVEQAATSGGWILQGQRRQGEALLALGLAKRLSELSRNTSLDIATALQRREELLRLADPRATGDFRWLVFQRFNPDGPPWDLRSSCLMEPPPMEAEVSPGASI